MLKTFYYSFEILEKPGVSEIKKDGLFKTIRNYYLLEKEKKIINSTNIFKKDFNGKFEKADIGNFSILYSYLEKRKKGIFGKKFFCEIILKGLVNELKVFEGWFYNKSQYTIIEQRQVTRARYVFYAQKTFLTDEEDFYYLSCSYGVQLKKYVKTYFPGLALKVSVKVKKRTIENEYRSPVVKDFSYKCIVEGNIHSTILFRDNFLNHRLSELLMNNSPTGFPESDTHNGLRFL